MRDFVELALQAAEVAGAAVMQHCETQVLEEHEKSMALPSLLAI